MSDPHRLPVQGVTGWQRHDPAASTTGFMIVTPGFPRVKGPARKERLAFPHPGQHLGSEELECAVKTATDPAEIHLVEAGFLVGVVRLNASAA